MRIDPLGFSLEHYDSTGRWREQYNDGKPIEDSAALADRTEIAGVKGLLDYLQVQDAQVRRTLSFKLLGYALGRTVMASDQPLVERMIAAGPSAGFSQLTAEVVSSKQFRNRQGIEAAPAGATTKVAGVKAPKRVSGEAMAAALKRDKREATPATANRKAGVATINSDFAKVGGR
jgi:hypothetical protein